jgi:hypothetical protein
MSGDLEKVLGVEWPIVVGVALSAEAAFGGLGVVGPIWSSSS